MDPVRKSELVGELRGTPAKDLTSTIVEAMQGRPKDEQKEIVKQVAAETTGRSLPLPDPPTNNTLWIIVVSAFAIVLVGGFTALALGLFYKTQATDPVKPELILTTFTTVVGFLAGLFAPSPVAHKTSSSK